MRRTLRCLVSLFAIVAFLFAQAAMAAHACAGPVPDPVAMAQMKAQMESDGGMCEKHCTTGAVSLELAKPAVSTMPSVAPVVLRVVYTPVQPRATPVRAADRSHAGPAPPLIRFTVLRI